MTILKANDKTAVRSHATRTILEKTDRILGQSEVKVRIQSTRDAGAPAYTDGKIITIGSDMDPIRKALKEGFTNSSMAIALALNYHELAHVMFTPRLDSDFVMRARSDGMFMALNMLEDQAAETRFVQLYEPARHYFTSLVTNYMMENDQYVQANYPLISGRLFLPERFRRSFRDNFAKPELIADIDRLVAEYKTLVWPDDNSAMYRVLKEFHELLADVDHSEPGTPHDNQTQGRPDTQRTRELVKEKEFVNDEPEKDKADEEEEDTGKGDKQAEDSDEQDDEGKEGDTGDDAEDASADGGSGSSAGDDDESEPLDLEDILEETMNEVMDEIEEELDDRIESIRNEESNYRPDAETEPAHKRDPEAEEVLTVNRCVDEFRRVEMHHAPGWHRQQRSGKLDPRRYAKALQGSDHVFKRWREGINDVLDFEVVFLLDQSGSMSRNMAAASVSLWTLKRTFEECNGVVTALGFSDDMTLLAQRFDNAKRHEVPIYGTIGGTVVQNALLEAKRILGVSTKPLKMCVVISDGGFHDTAEAGHIVRDFGNPVVFVGIEHDVTKWKDHPNVTHTQTITDPAELVDVVKNIALRLSDERLSKRGMA